MKTIGFVTQKGGAGKSTACIALATALAKKHRVALVDLDKQRSVGRWSEMTTLPANLEVFTATKAGDLKHLSGFDFAVVDTAGVLSADVLKHLDLAVIPAQPSAFDVWAAAETVELVKLHKEHRGEGFDAVFLVNRQQPKTVLGKEIEAALAEYELPVLDVAMHQRSAYAKSIAQGKNPVASGDSGARLESLRLAESVKKVLGVR